jgi:hypothetical protein
LSDSEGEEGEISRDSNEIFLLSSVESKTIKTGYVALVAEIQVWYLLMLSWTSWRSLQYCNLYSCGFLFKSEVKTPTL